MGTAQSTVSSKFTSSSSMANSAWSLVQSTINSLATRTLSFDMPIDIVLDPAYTSAPFTTDLPESPDFPDVPQIEDAFTMPDFPAAPAVSLPSRPVLRDFIIPDFQSDIAISAFSETLPEVNLQPIQEADVIALFGYLVTDYKPQLSEIKELLITRITEGGTGLPADVESDIWNRNLERDQQALQDAVDAVTAQWAKLGFTLPDGMLANSILAVNNEYVNKRLDTSRDIAVKQAELEQTNINESLKLVAAIEEAYNGAMGQYANVCAGALKAAGELSVALYNSVVQYYNMLIDMYKAKSEVYKTLVQARLADAEVYKTQVEGVGMAISADESKVKVYVAEIGAEESKLKAYESEIKGVIARVDASKAWLDVGKTRMELFAAETQALNARFAGQIEGFKAELMAWAGDNDRMMKEKELALREQTVELEARLKQLELAIKNYEFLVTNDTQVMASITQVGAHVVSGALASAHAAASISESEETVISG